MTEAPPGAQAGLARDDRAEQFVGVQAALHQQFGLALPHQFHRLRGGGAAVGSVDDLDRAEVDALLLRDAPDFAAGPTRIGVISPASPASIAPASAVSSQGYATAVGIGARFLQRSSSFSYFPVPVFLFMVSLLQLAPAAQPGPFP